MKWESKHKALVFAVFALVFVSSSVAVTSEFTTSPPDTQEINEDFTIEGEVSTGFFWESDLESIMIQSKAESESTWFVEKETDIGCYGDSCSISSDSISHDTAEDVEYRIVAMDNAGDTVPDSPLPSTVEFTEASGSEQAIEISTLEVVDSHVEEGESTEFEAEVTANEDVDGFSSSFYVSGESAATGTHNIDAGESKTISATLTWDQLNNIVETGQDHDLDLELSHYSFDSDIERSIEDGFHLAVAQEEREVSFQNFPDSFTQDEEHEIEAEASDSTGNLYGQELVLKKRKYLRGGSWGSWERFGGDYCWDDTSGEQCSISGTFSPDLSGRHEIKASIIAEDGEILEKSREISVEDGDPKLEISTLEVVDSHVEEGESTEFEAEVTANEDVDGFSSSFYVSGESAATGTHNIDAGESKTISATLTWDELSNIVETGQDHDLDLELSHYSFDSDIERNINEGLYLATANDEESKVEIRGLESTDTDIEEGESTDFEAEVHANERIDGLQLSYYVDGESVGEGKSVNFNYGETDMVSEEFSWVDLSDQFNTGEDHDLEVRIDHYKLDSEITETENDAFFLAERDEANGNEPIVEISNLKSTDTDIEEGESTKFEADVTANEDVSGYSANFIVSGESAATGTQNIDEGESATLSSTLSWNDITDVVETGEDHDLKLELSHYSFDEDISRTESDAFFLAEPDSDEGDSPVEINDLESTDTNINEGEDTDFEAEIHANERLDGLQVNYYVNGEFVGDGSTVNLNSGDTDTISEEFSWEDLSDRFDTGEDHDLEVRLDHYKIESDISETDYDSYYLGDRDDDNRPEADFNWDRHPPVEGESVEFDGSSSSDPDGDIEEYRWDFDDGSGYSYGENEDHTFGTAGDYDVELRVEDSNGNTDTRTREVEVVEEEGDCSLNIGRLRFDDDVITEGESTEASITVSNNGDDQEFTVEFRVESDEVRTIEREISGGSQSTFTASVSPERDSVVTVEISTENDPCGNRNYERSEELVVVGGDNDNNDEDGGREPDSSFSWNPSMPESGETITFDGSESSDRDDDIVEYRWFFGDGSSTGYGQTVQHSYGSVGDYDVQLVVEDSEGNTDSFTRTVPVADEPGTCSISVGRLRFGDSIIERGEATSGEVTVSNLGDEEQVVNIDYRVEGSTVDSKQSSVDANSQRTFSTVLSPERDSLVTAEVTTEGEPCGQRSYKKTEELIVTEGAGDSGEATLEVNARTDGEKRLSNARVRVEGPEAITRYTDTTGQAYFELEGGEYDVSVSKPGYSTDVRDLDLDPGDRRSITVNLGRGNTDTGNLVTLVEDAEGNRLEDADITVENGLTINSETDSGGRAAIDLEEGTYTVTAEKEGYGSWTESLNIDRGEETVEVFRLTEGVKQEGLNVLNIDYPETVCRGSTMTADITVENNAGFHDLVTVTGKGLGSINSLSDFSLEEEESVQKTIRFTNVRGTGEEQFTITANNEVSDSETRTVEVESCGTTSSGEATGISITLDYPRQPNIAVEGDMIEVEGFVDGAYGRSNVDISIDGETKASVRTLPDGYYKTWITATDVGSKTVKAETGEVSASQALRIIPASRVSGIDAPVSVFDGKDFRICAQVESQIEPEVILERDGEVVKSKVDDGRVCFEQTAREPGMHNYRVAALTSGESNSASKTIETLEMDTEASSFPNQIASVESGSGLVKVELYNNNDEQRTYDLELEGLPSTWVSQSEKKVILSKGERRTVYFYLTPKEEGSFRPTIKVEAAGEQIYEEQLDLISGGIKESQEKEDEGFVQGVVNGIESGWNNFVSLISF